MSSTVRLIFVLALFCIVNASVITYNTFDDNVEDANALNDSPDSDLSRRCKIKECIEECKGKGYKTGVCTFSKCKCLMKNNHQDDVNEVPNTPPEFSENPDFLSARNCSYQNCTRDCRNRGYKKGVCILGKCKCYFKISNNDDATEDEDTLPEPFDSVSIRKCNNKDCRRECAKKGYISGTCVFGRCRCQTTPLNDEVITSADALPEPADLESERSCNNQRCQQICRRLGFSHGVCRNGRCVCSRRMNAEDESTETAEFSPLRFDSDAAEVASERACNLRECEQRCRRIGFPGGACVNGRCKCDIRFGSEDEMMTILSGPAESESERSCNNQRCQQICRRYGFSRGVCRNGRCVCIRRMNAEDEVSEPAEFSPLGFESDSDEAASERACNLRECERRCRRIGFPGGACVNGRCKCDIRFGNENEVIPSLDVLPDPAELELERSCNNQRCQQICRRYGFSRGVCRNGRCVCSRRMNAEDEVSEPTEFSLLGFDSDSADVASERACNLRECEQRCRRIGFPGGACVNGRCKCDNRLGTEVEVMPSSDSLPEPAELESQRRCNQQTCQQICRRFGFPVGVCVNGRCRCNRRISTEDEVMPSSNILPEPAELESERSCNQQRCQQICRRLGFSQGVCRNGRCVCSRRINSEDEVSEPAEFNLLGFDSDSADAASERACNLRECERRCRRIGFPGGACFNGRCKCDIRFGSEDEVMTTLSEPAELESERSCNQQRCQQICRRFGFSQGVCRNGRCVCSRRINREDDIAESSVYNLDSAEVDAEERACNLRECEQRCRRIGFPGGACVNGRCKCDIRLASEDEEMLSLDTLPEPAELESERKCNQPRCQQICRRFGFSQGVCKNGRCVCSRRMNTEDSLVASESSGKNIELDVSNLIDKTDEDEMNAS